MWKGASLGSVHSSYIHGHAWLSDWDMSRGAGGRVCSWLLLWRLLSLPQGLGSGLGSPHLCREGQPLPGHCTLLEEVLERALSPRPLPLHPPAHSGVVGEVADRFPGQHRGRLGWSSGQQGRGQVSPGTPPTPSLVLPPSRHCALWSRGSPDLSHFHALKPGRPGRCWALCSRRLGSGKAQAVGLGDRAEGLTPAVSCLLPPEGGCPL